jgi:hypothetical protein
MILKYLKNKRDKIQNYFIKIDNAKLSWTEGYGTGVEETTRILKDQINSLTERMTSLTNENLAMEEKLRVTYNDRLATLDGQYTENCKKCMEMTNQERERMRQNQNIILDLIHTFNLIYMKVFKHASLVIDEHDTIIKASGRIKASRDILTGIRQEADEIIKKALPYVGIEPGIDDQKLLDNVVNMKK